MQNNILLFASYRALAIGIAALAFSSSASLAQTASAQDSASNREEANSSADSIPEIIVTAQKRAQSINKVGMSITAASNAELVSRGITSTADLAKAVPGFTFNTNPYGIPIYTIRGVGFQESALAASPAVSIYVDEIPLPFPAETVLTGLDIERVEVLKGPQGTLYGQNSTGGAINYISARPTEDLHAGADVSYGRFNTLISQGFVSGPLASNLNARLSLGLNRGGAWQKSYTRDDSTGETRQLQGRLLLDWKPTETVKVTLGANGWRDRSDTIASQFVGTHLQAAAGTIPPEVLNYPIAPRNARAADWDPGIPLKKNNYFFQGSARIDWDLSDDITLTSITAYQKYRRRETIDQDGTAYNNFFIRQNDKIETFYQEMRLSGKFGDQGSWIVGANYEHDKTRDDQRPTYNDSSYVTGVGFTEHKNIAIQPIKTYAVFANLEHKITDTVSLQGAVRFTQVNRGLHGCSGDSGNGALAAFFTGFRAFFRTNAGLDAGDPLLPGTCATLGPPPEYDVLDVRLKLNQNNISWRGTVNWEPDRSTLVYATVSRGYKSGSFPNIGAATIDVWTPARQETVLAYEAGIKKTFLDGAVHINAAAFYYDYKDKQFRGSVPTAPFGFLFRLLNFPKSHVAGFEVSGDIRPVEGLRISPGITLVASQIDGHTFAYTPFATDASVDGAVLISGERFPYTPKWSGNVDFEYKTNVSSDVDFYLGGNANFQSHTNAALGSLPEFNVPGYTVVDARTGFQKEDGSWRAGLFVRNLTNKYYFTTVNYVVDAVTRFTGMPRTYGVSLSFRY